jgi:glycosyltransferase involved in cell wall biosynthesis
MHKFPKVPLFFLPVTVNRELLENQEQDRPPRALTLFYSGSFNEKDGLPYLLEGLYLTRKAGVPLRLMLSGKGTAKEMELFWETVRRFGLADIVDYKGFLTRTAYLQSLSSGADVFCMTRINSAYANAGFPFKLGEFLATGKPVIASKVGDVEKYLTNNDAYLVNPENPEEIKNALVDIARFPLLAKVAGLNGREVARKYFDHENYAGPLRHFLAEQIWA